MSMSPASPPPFLRPSANASSSPFAARTIAGMRYDLYPSSPDLNTVTRATSAVDSAGARHIASMIANVRVAIVVGMQTIIELAQLVRLAELDTPYLCASPFDLSKFRPHLCQELRDQLFGLVRPVRQRKRFDRQVATISTVANDFDQPRQVGPNFAFLAERTLLDLHVHRVRHDFGDVDVGVGR